MNHTHTLPAFLKSKICLATLVALTASPFTYAQQEDEPASEEGIEQIVVTASKRTSTAQDTAIAMDVMGANALSQNGVGDIAQLQSISPGVQIGTSATATIVTVRGVSGRDTTEIGDPAVAINMDGVFLQRPSGMNASFFDLDRIEVLRGPQGTLYGRNATGGVINIISKRPDFELGGYGAVTLGNYNTVNSEGAFNLPLSDSFAVRASYASKNHDGYRDNSRSALEDTPELNIPGVGGPENRVTVRGDDEDSQSARLQLLYDGGKNLTFLLSGTKVSQGGNGPVIAGYPTSRETPPTDASEAKTFALSEPGDFKLDRENLMAEVNYDFGFATATYIFGSAKLDVDHLYDNDGTETGTGYDFRRGEYSTDISHELRLSSNGDGPFSWQAGAFFYDQDLDVRSLNFISPDDSDPVFLRNYLFNVQVESKAVFGQIGYEFTDELKMTAGLRYSEDSKERTGTFVGGPSLANPPLKQPELTVIELGEGSRSDDDDLSYHLGAEYRYSDDTLFYAKTDKGYKSGGFTSINEYGPETVLAYEVGAKNRLLNNRLQLNASVFLYDYQDQQVSQLTEEGVQVQNAGSSTVKGIEVETKWMPTQDDTVDLSVNWLDARYDDFKVRVGDENVDQAGNRLIQAPEWAISGGYEHFIELSDGSTIVPRAQFLYRSESYFTFFNNANDRQEAYTTIDLSLTYKPASQAWLVQAYGRNVTDEVILTSASTSSFTGTNGYQFAAPRTFGVRFSADF